MDFFFGHARPPGFALPHQTQQDGGRTRQQSDKGAGNDCQQIHRPGHQSGNPLRVDLADPLRHQFANHDRYIGDDQNDKNRCADLATPLLDPERLQPDRQGPGEGSFADDAAKNGDRGDSYLYRRQEAIGIIAQLDCHSGRAVSIFGQLGQTSPAGSNQGNFGHGKNTIEQNQGKKYEYFHYSSPKTGLSLLLTTEILPLDPGNVTSRKPKHSNQLTAFRTIPVTSESPSTFPEFTRLDFSLAALHNTPHPSLEHHPR